MWMWTIYPTLKPDIPVANLNISWSATEIYTKIIWPTLNPDISTPNHKDHILLGTFWSTNENYSQGPQRWLQANNGKQQFSRSTAAQQSRYTGRRGSGQSIVKSEGASRDRRAVVLSRLPFVTGFPG
ncbi:hypothetical protein J6590_044797 [Homalodisca vitripennis]|nr:hypothetical protein J6590_044797 [Homalodisca vitripennis]